MPCRGEKKGVARNLKNGSESTTCPLEHAWFKWRKRLKSNVIKEGESFQGSLMNSGGASGRNGVQAPLKAGWFQANLWPNQNHLHEGEQVWGREMGQTEHRVQAIHLLTVVSAPSSHISASVPVPLWGSVILCGHPPGHGNLGTFPFLPPLGSFALCKDHYSPSSSQTPPLSPQPTKAPQVEGSWIYIPHTSVPPPAGAPGGSLSQLGWPTGPECGLWLYNMFSEWWKVGTSKPGKGWQNIHVPFIVFSFHISMAFSDDKEMPDHYEKYILGLQNHNEMKI